LSPQELDDNQCTTDSCDSETGCVYVVVDCDDDNECTIDLYDTDSGCYYTAVTVMIQCLYIRSYTTDTCCPIDGCQYADVVML